MALTAAFREQNAFGVDDPPSSRDEVFARYRQFREISKQHHSAVLNFLPKDTVISHARRIGLAQGKTLVLDSSRFAAPPGGHWTLCKAARLGLG